MGLKDHVRAFLRELLSASSALGVGLLAILAIACVALFLIFSPQVHLPFQTSAGLGILLVATLVWIVRLLLQRRLRSAGALTLTLLVSLVGLWFLNEATYRAKAVEHYDRWADDLLSVRVSFDPPVFACESARDFRGEGYSLAIFELPAELEEKFRAPDLHYLAKNPRVPRDWPHFSRVRWQPTPLPAAYAPHLEFALPDETGCSYCQPDCSTLAQHLEEARRTATSSGSYVSFIDRYASRPRPSDIVLFLVSLEDHRIYFANNNQ